MTLTVMENLVQMIPRRKKREREEEEEQEQDQEGLIRFMLFTTNAKESSLRYFFNQF